MGEGEKKSGLEKKSININEVKAELLGLLTVQENERRRAVVRMVELETELEALKDRVTFLKGATEGLKAGIQACVNGPTPKAKKEEKEEKK